MIAGRTNMVRRADDNEDALRTRLMEYYKKTSPLIGYYYAKGQLSSVDGLADMDAVAASIATVLDEARLIGVPALDGRVKTPYCTASRKGIVSAFGFLKIANEIIKGGFAVLGL